MERGECARGLTGAALEAFCHCPCDPQDGQWSHQCSVRVRGGCGAGELSTETVVAPKEGAHTSRPALPYRVLGQCGDVETGWRFPEEGLLEQGSCRSSAFPCVAVGVEDPLWPKLHFA